MKKYYLDNASTTKTKPETVYDAINDTLRNIGCSPSRGSYYCSLQAGRLVFKTRNKLAKLFNVEDSRYIVFTPGITYSINTALRGLLNEGDHVITTCMEHNAVSRPLRTLKQQKNIDITWIPADTNGHINISDVEKAILPNTKLMVVNHASNIIGTILPLAEITAIAKKHNIYTIADCAQTAGYCDINFTQLGLDVLAFTGHKALYGPPGTGGMVLSKRAAKEMRPLIVGGTGSSSTKQFQPDHMPEKFESGTQNTAGIAGLGAGVQFILDTKTEIIRKHEQQLLQQLLTGLKQIDNIKIYYSGDVKQQVPTISITINNLEMGEMSIVLDEKYGIMTRSGVHCSPLSHNSVGTLKTGTIRLSIGYFNTAEEITYVIKSLKDLAQGAPSE